MRRLMSRAYSAPPLERLHLSHVEGLRALAALVVFVNHSYAQAAFPGHQPEAAWYLRPFMHFMVFGHLSVSVFIVISGFCLALPVVDSGGRIVNGVAQFMLRRARRILPPYYAALALCLLLIATIIGTRTGSPWDVPIDFEARDVLIHVLLLQDLFSTGKINYVFWSIAVEWQIYFLFPLLVIVARRFGIFQLAVAALVLGYAVRFLGDGTRIERANPHFVGLFALGMLAAYWVRSPQLQSLRERTKGTFGWVGLACFVFVCAACHFLGLRGPFHFAELDLPVGVMAFAVLIHSTLEKGSWLARSLNAKWVVWMGTFSYSIYLIHAPLLQIMWQYGVNPLGLGKPETFALLTLGGGPLVVGVSYAFFLIFERPFMRSQRKVAAVAAAARA